MRVQFDSQIFFAQRVGGISRYFISLVEAMNALALATPDISAALHLNDYLASLQPGSARRLYLRRLRRMPGLLRGLDLVADAAWMRLRRPDIVHRTYYYPVLRAPRRARTVLTVYDMIHERYPGDFSPDDPIARWKAAAIAKADHVICISHHTRRDVLEMCGTDPRKVSVTHLGFASLAGLGSASGAQDFRARLWGRDQPYILFVGSRTPYKNFHGLLRAFAASARLRTDFRVLAFGGGPFTPAEQQLIAELGLAGEVRQMGGSDDLLADSYRHAAVLVYPSYYEGFGIPPLEAMSLGCPVVSSNTSSLPEVVADAAECFDPADPGALARAVETVLYSEGRREQLRRLGLERCQQFSWERCARDTLAVYEQALGG